MEYAQEFQERVEEYLLYVEEIPNTVVQEIMQKLNDFLEKDTSQRRNTYKMAKVSAPFFERNKQRAIAEKTLLLSGWREDVFLSWMILYQGEKKEEEKFYFYFLWDPQKEK